MRITGLIVALLSISSSVSSMIAVPQQNAFLIEESNRAYFAAQKLEVKLNAKAESERRRDDYLKVISAYERVYLITPHTSYADNSLMAIRRKGPCASQCGEIAKDGCGGQCSLLGRSKLRPHCR
jgi:hypothetical protein